MADFNVNPNGLLDTADELQVIQNRLSSALSALDTAVNEFESRSAGQAIGSFNAAQVKWNAAMGRMQQALDTAKLELGNIHNQYQIGDKRSAAIFDGLV